MPGTNYFAENGFSNAVDPLQHPCAQHFNGRTYLAYQGPLEDAYVCVYDHVTKSWEGPALAGVSHMGKPGSEQKKVDNHGRPALIIDDDGYVHLAFGGHGGHAALGDNPFGVASGRGEQTHVVTERAEDISSWEVQDNVSKRGTYSQFVKMDDGEIFLFYRHGGHKSDWVIQRSVDSGKTFTAAEPYLKHNLRPNVPGVHDSWYMWFTRLKDGVVGCMYVYHLCGETDHQPTRYNVYYMAWDTDQGRWTNAAGDSLQMPLTRPDADRQTLVFDSGGERCNHCVCKTDSRGNPHVLFRYGPTGRVHHTRWEDGAWTVPVGITDTLNRQDGDMILESSGGIRVIMHGDREGGGGEVAWWRSDDGGVSWSQEQVVLESDRMRYHLSALVHDAHPEGQIVIYEIDPEATDEYRKLYLWGNGGIVQRETV
jgi:hypothetical protein